MASPMKIYRFLEGGDYERHVTLPAFQAFVWNHAVIAPKQAVEIKIERELQQSEPVLSLSYFNVLDRGLAEWSSPWFDWLQQTTGKLIPPPEKEYMGAVSHAVTWGGRDFIDWPHFTFAKVQEMVSLMRNEFGGDGLFFDQYWRLVHDWMFSSLGAPHSAFPVQYWIVWRWCHDFLAQFANEVTGGKVWANSGFAYHSAPHCHRIYEHAQHDYDSTMTAWREDMAKGKESVITVDANAAPWAVDRLLADWRAIGHGWIGFTTQDGSPEAAAKVDHAYERAAAVQSGAVPTVPPSPMFAAGAS